MDPNQAMALALKARPQAGPTPEEQQLLNDMTANPRDVPWGTLVPHLYQLYGGLQPPNVPLRSFTPRR
jgi:hypothetical protein